MRRYRNTICLLPLVDKSKNPIHHASSKAPAPRLSNPPNPMSIKLPMVLSSPSPNALAQRLTRSPYSPDPPFAVQGHPPSLLKSSPPIFKQDSQTIMSNHQAGIPRVAFHPVAFDGEADEHDLGESIDIQGLVDCPGSGTGPPYCRTRINKLDCRTGLSSRIFNNRTN